MISSIKILANNWLEIASRISQNHLFLSKLIKLPRRTRSTPSIIQLADSAPDLAESNRY